MKAETTVLAGRQCRYVLYPDRPVVFRGVPDDDWDVARLRKEEESLAALQAGSFFFGVGEWNDVFSPWPAKTRAGEFGGGAAETLRWLEENAIPYLRPLTQAPLILTGYSLAGLFSIWCMSNTGAFAAYVSCSGSLWYPGWEEYSRTALAKARCAVYLSLGDRESRTRNPDLQRVEEATVAQSLTLVRDRNVRSSVLVMEPGGHFNEPDARLLRGIRWTLEHLTEKPFGETDMRTETILPKEGRTT